MLEPACCQTKPTGWSVKVLLTLLALLTGLSPWHMGRLQKSPDVNIFRLRECLLISVTVTKLAECVGEFPYIEGNAFIPSPYKAQ